MAGWFDRLMRGSRARTVGDSSPRDARYDAVVQTLRDRDAEDRLAREQRQRWYRQHLSGASGIGGGVATPSPPLRLHKFRTKVPCRATPEARALLHKIRKQWGRAGNTITFPRITSTRQAVMLTAGAGELVQIGWLEHGVEADPKRCNVRDQGLWVDADGTMLVLQFRHPPTAVKMSSRELAAPAVEVGLDLPFGTLDEMVSVDFTEIRPALDLRAGEKAASPRLVWITRPPEAEAVNALNSRDYEAFYSRFKVEVLAGVWSSLSSVLSSAPGSQLHQDTYYTVVREPDAATGRICQRTIDDTGHSVDIGSDRIYDAFAATDILLLYLESDILADVADIYFTVQNLGSSDAYSLKEEFFTIIRRFWARSRSLASSYGSDLATVVRMSQRAVPMPAQIPLLKQEWSNLRHSLVDRYGEKGRKAPDLIGDHIHRPRRGPLAWPFASFRVGDVNIGLRLVYRQEWRHVGAQRGEAVRTVPVAWPRDEQKATIVETTIVPRGATRNLAAIVDDAVKATVEATKWPRDTDGGINTGVRGLAGISDLGLDAECRESSRDTGLRLGDLVVGMASSESSESPNTVALRDGGDEDSATYVYSKVHNRYEVLTRLVEIQNVVLVAERLPTPAEIDLSWARRHATMLASVLLDESVRDTLDAIAVDTSPDDAWKTKRDRLYEHLRDNILHYQRAIWRQEDPQQRTMRYRKAGGKVPLEWVFELEAGHALTIDELGERLLASNVDGQFAAYSNGRVAALDELIDPAGPIGYYGNYAVYPMRPEFGSEELFSMLHFFKSPYLRANQATGEPEIADPDQIHLSESSFRAERARCIALEADSVVMDVIRSVETTVVEPDGGASTKDLDVPDGYGLQLENASPLERLSVTGVRDPKGEWAILAGAHKLQPRLLAGALRIAVRASGPDDERAIVVHDDRVPTPRLQAGGGAAHDADRECVILPRDDSTKKTLVGAEPARIQERVIVVRDDEWVRPSPLAE